MNRAPREFEDLVLRLARLGPTSARRWGTLTAHEMLCHLADSLAMALGEREVAPAGTWFSRSIQRWLVLHTPLRRPHGMRTRPELDPHRQGTRPVEFERDRTALIELLQRFADPGARYGRHPAYGALSRAEWLRWGQDHVDHHLRQFGL